MRQRTAAAVSAVPRIAPIRLAQSKLSLIRDLAGALQSALVPLACIVFATGYCFDDLYVALLGTVLMFTANIVFGCLRLRERLLFLFLHAGIALFLLTRPVIGTLDDHRTWMLSSPESTWFAITAIFVSLVFLFLGAVTYSTVVSFNERRRKERDELRSGIEVVGASEEAFGRNARGILGSVADLTSKLKHSERIRYIRTASLLCFLVCYIAALYEGYIKLSYMSGLAYEEYYLIDADEHVPWIIRRASPHDVVCVLLLSCVHAAPPSYGYLPCAVCFHYRAHADDRLSIRFRHRVFVRGALLRFACGDRYRRALDYQTLDNGGVHSGPPLASSQWAP